MAISRDVCGTDPAAETLLLSVAGPAGRHPLLLRQQGGETDVASHGAPP